MNIVTVKDLQKLDHHKQVCFALFCTKQVEHLSQTPEGKTCIEVVERWLAGEATAEECKRLADIAYMAPTTIHATIHAARVIYAAVYTIHAAVYTIHAAIYAARTASYTMSYDNEREHRLKAQWDYYDELLNADKYLEEILLGS